MEIHVCPHKINPVLSSTLVKCSVFGEMKLYHTEALTYLLLCIQPSGKKIDDFRHLGGETFKRLHKEFISVQKKLIIYMNHLFEALAEAAEKKQYVTAFMEGWYLAEYRFQKYLRTPSQLDYLVEYSYSIYGECIKSAKTISDAVCIARDLCNEPPNKLTPASYAQKITEIFKETEVVVDIMDVTDLAKHGLEAVSMVGKGSVNPPKMVVLTLKKVETKHVALVGKGVTFDSGGVNVKTGTGLWEMKMDMGGSAAVVGAMKLLADLNRGVYVTAVIPLVENLAGTNAYLPADVIPFSNGIHVEVGNTDAEGRLILADSMLYAQALGVETIVDIATLTGSIGQALGLKTAGIFSNQEADLWEYKEMGEEAGDHVWPMPLLNDYKTYLQSDCADLNNMSSSKYGGSITAAVFLSHFIQKNTKWIHIDMANTVRPWKQHGYYVKGASGFGVRLLTKLVEKEFEK
ncbi:leucyl aminopeptidase family protein [Roseburia sp. 1XD42-34]|uniref:leucyl aminopeptidase family protein n=2 Tax=Clostridia TaxID=186801 RepID=UPI001314B3D7|nr:leucyl aminopeptidase family protein [Roseburia sp. 1XD42-34]